MSAPVTHWTASRKSEVIAAIRRNETTAAQAMAEHGLSEEELGSWAVRFARFGHAGLAAGNVQALRP